MISYPWNAAWASVHSPAERHEIIRLLEEEAISSYHQLKVRTGTHLEALCAGVVIVIALADAAKIHKVRSGLKFRTVWLVTDSLVVP